MIACIGNYRLCFATSILHHFFQQSSVHDFCKHEGNCEESVKS